MGAFKICGCGQGMDMPTTEEVLGVNNATWDCPSCGWEHDIEMYTDINEVVYELIQEVKELKEKIDGLQIPNGHNPRQG